MWVQSETFICSIFVLNLNESFNFCARLGFNVIWFVQCMKIRKSKIEIIAQFIDTMHYQVSPLSYTRSTKTICLNLVLTHLLNFFIVNKRISNTPFLLVKVCVATNLCIYGIYASDNIYCILAGFQVLLSVTGMLVDLSVTIMQVTVSVAVMQ